MVRAKSWERAPAGAASALAAHWHWLQHWQAGADVPSFLVPPPSVMGGGASSPAGAPGVICKRSGFPDAVTDADVSGCEGAEGVLDKQTRRGGWQPRYFKVRSPERASRGQGLCSRRLYASLSLAMTARVPSFVLSPGANLPPASGRS